MRFYLGTHKHHWLQCTDVPLFISRRRLEDPPNRKRPWRPAIGRWALDSGGFTELSMPPHRWVTTPVEYVDNARRYMAEIGNLDFAAPQDWMCEPHMLANTGKDVDAHQKLTVENYLTLAQLAPDVPFIPVLQGWTVDDYLRCAQLYRDAGVDLSVGTVGVGSVCRRQHTDEAVQIFTELRSVAPGLHGFGLKTKALRNLPDDILASADSMAWSFDARYGKPLPGCTHKQCQNCLRYALAWRSRLLGDAG